MIIEELGLSTGGIICLSSQRKLFSNQDLRIPLACGGIKGGKSLKIAENPNNRGENP